jgi:hypothetical protein
MSRRLKGSSYIAGKEEIKNAHKIFIGKYEERICPENGGIN